MHKGLVLLTVLLFQILCKGQSVDAVIDRYCKAIGGRDAWKSITTMKKTAVFTKQGETHPFVPKKSLSRVINQEFIYKRPDKIKSISREGYDSIGGIMCYDGEHMWIKFGANPPSQLTKDHADFFVANSMMGPADLLLDSTARISYKGKRQVNERECEVLEIMREHWVIPYEYFFDGETSLLVCATAPQSHAKRITYFKEYKKFGNVLIHTVEQVFFNGLEESIGITKAITLDDHIDDAVFKMTN